MFLLKRPNPPTILYMSKGINLVPTNWLSSSKLWLILATLIIIAIGTYGLVFKSAPAEETLVAENTPVNVLAGPTMSSSTPTTLRIPKLSISAPFTEPLGLLEDGEVAVPDSDTKVGWYKYSPTPGALGPAVILGHVDSYTGPAVFFYLGQLEPGDDIFVDREDGTTAHFKVESLERPRQAEFPTARVYGNIDHAGLRLITCSGLYVKGKQRYTHNLVVYARLVS
jgi:sortase (surface protein transpeptidase)